MTTRTTDRWRVMSGTTIRIVGVAAALVAAATVGLAVARATQAPDPSQIPLVQTSRPVGSTTTQTPTNAQTGPISAPTNTIQQPVEATPPFTDRERRGDMVVPPVRDQEHDRDEDDDD